MDDGYRSRKFIVTMFGMMLGTGILMFGALYVPPVEYWGALPPFFILLAAGISAYNWSNLRQSQAGKVVQP